MRRLVGVLGALLVGVACGDGGTTKTNAGSATSTSAPSTTQPAPTTTAAPTGVVVTAENALLVPPARPIPHANKPASVDCSALTSEGWTLSDCGSVEMVDGRRVWLVDSRPATAAKKIGPTERRARVVHFASASAGWVVDLSFGDELAEGTGMSFKAADVTGDGRPELVFWFRSQGTGGFLSYDVVLAGPGTRVGVQASRRLTKGRASLAGGVITDYEAKYPNREPNCCPAFFQKSVLRYSGGMFRATETERVDVNALGPRGPLDF